MIKLGCGHTVTLEEPTGMLKEAKAPFRISKAPFCPVCGEDNSIEVNDGGTAGTTYISSGGIRTTKPL